MRDEKRERLCRLLKILIALTLAFIWINSLMPRAESQAISLGLLERIVELLRVLGIRLSPKSDHLLRKLHRIWHTGGGAEPAAAPEGQAEPPGLCELRLCRALRRSYRRVFTDPFPPGLPGTGCAAGLLRLPGRALALLSDISKRLPKAGRQRQSPVKNSGSGRSFFIPFSLWAFKESAIACCQIR